MIYLVVDRDNNEYLFNSCPKYDRLMDKWVNINENIYYKFNNVDNGIDGAYDEPSFRPYIDKGILLPKGTIKKLTGKTLTINDEPYEFYE